MIRKALCVTFWLACLLGPVRTVWCEDADASTQSSPGVEIARQKGPAQPQVAVDRKGNVHIVFGERNFVSYAVSKDGGVGPVEPVEAFECQNMSLGMRRGPRLALSGETPVVTAIGGEQGKGRDGDVQAWRREEDGTWSGPVRVNDVGDSAREGLHGMSSGPDGSIWCVWLDLRSKGTKVYGARSVDGGKTWGRNVLVYQCPEKSVCECCHPSVAVGPQNRVTVLFRNSFKGNRDMFVVTSVDGETFAPAVPLSKQTWKLAACPMDGGMLALAVGSAEGWGTYRRDKQVFLAPVGSLKSGGVETLLGTGDQPTVAAVVGGPIAVWTSGGDLMIKGPRDNAPRRLASEARFPSIASGQTGELAAIAWEEKSSEKLGTVVRLKVFPAGPK